MMLISELVDDYMERIDQAVTVKEAQRIRDDLLLCSYQLSDQDKAVVRQQMHPFLVEIGRELAKTDPLVQRAHQLLGIN